MGGRPAGWREGWGGVTEPRREGGVGVGLWEGTPELKLEGRARGRAAVELPDEIKKKSFSQSVQAAVQSSDLICFQGPFCFLLSCCASNRATAMRNVNPRLATSCRAAFPAQCFDSGRRSERLG